MRGQGSPIFLQRRKLLAELDNAADFAQFRQLAQQLDELDGVEQWRREYESPDYDFHLIADRLEALQLARRSRDPRQMMFLLRSSLLRNIGGMGNPKLFVRSRVGTKKLIESYIDEVVYQLHHLANLEDSQVPLEERLAFIRETRHAFGQSALLLSGGGTLGLFHVGVLKALMELDLLPKVVSGSSAGSIMAGILCCKTEEELLEQLKPENMILEAFDHGGEEAQIWNKLQRLVRDGYASDMKVLEECCRKNMGDYTFAEAHRRTGRVLNISVNSTREHDRPRILNYLTAPHVFVWSATCASCALPGLFPAVELKAKGANGEIIPWTAGDARWSDGSVECDLPFARLAELFNVNHFIVCQVNPHVMPFTREATGDKSLVPESVRAFVRSELRFRLQQVHQHGWFPKTTFSLRHFLFQEYEGDITIVPSIRWRDYLWTFRNPSVEFVERAVMVGQRAAWGKVPIIQNHLEIELTLEQLEQTLAGRLAAGTHERASTPTRLLRVRAGSQGSSSSSLQLRDLTRAHRDDEPPTAGPVPALRPSVSVSTLVGAGRSVSLA
jgi:predicted acylesterase/phospholipase RssA